MCIDIDRIDFIGTDVKVLYEGYDPNTCYRVVSLDKFPIQNLKLLKPWTNKL